MRVERVDSQAVKDKFASLKSNKGKVSAKDCKFIWFILTTSIFETKRGRKKAIRRRTKVVVV